MRSKNLYLFFTVFFIFQNFYSQIFREEFYEDYVASLWDVFLLNPSFDDIVFLKKTAFEQWESLRGVGTLATHLPTNESESPAPLMDKSKEAVFKGYSLWMQVVHDAIVEGLLFSFAPPEFFTDFFKRTPQESIKEMVVPRDDLINEKEFNSYRYAALLKSSSYFADQEKRIEYIQKEIPWFVLKEKIKIVGLLLKSCEEKLQKLQTDSQWNICKIL